MFQCFQDLSDITDANSLNSLSSKLESLDFVNNPVIVNGGQLKVKLNFKCIYVKTGFDQGATLSSLNDC